ncbi:MAG: pyruvate kinase [Dehalococcoidia bacterium]
MADFRRTKIVATLGPATSQPDVLRQIIDAGVDVCRLNFSHGDHAEKRALIKLIREVGANAGKPVAILQDLQGPKIRVGPLDVPEFVIKQGQRVRIYGDDRTGDGETLSVGYEPLARDASPGDLVFIDDGLIELRIIQVEDDSVIAETLVGGHVRPRQGVNFPSVPLETPCLTEKDEADLAFGLEEGVDMVALSFVRKPQDAAPVRAIYHQFGVNPPLVAKIERPEALAAIDGVLQTFDVVMVARGDLGVNLRPEKVPTAQKQIIKRALATGKPVITATQMLESMTYNSIPTRAEASDVANAVVDGTDAVMLSGETAVGKYPVETVTTMDRIVREAEGQPLDPLPRLEMPPSSMVGFCTAAVKLANDVGASALAALTRNGENAQTLSALRPELPIFALCEDQRQIYQLNVRHGILPLHIERPGAIEEVSATIGREIAARNLLPEGSRVIVVGVAPGSITGRTDFIRLITV